MPRREPCCLGERSLDGDPQGMHSMDCPVYLANVAAWEQRHRRTPTQVGATTPRANEQPRSVGTTLIIAWDTRWCPDCSSRYFAEDAICCGEPCMPVRLEMHSREPL